jgi:hypothetical protein
MMESRTTPVPTDVSAPAQAHNISEMAPSPSSLNDLQCFIVFLQLIRCGRVS